MTLRSPAVICALVIAFLGVVALFWIGSADHYNACVKAASERYAPLVEPGGKAIHHFSLGDTTVRQRAPRDLNALARRSAVEGCSYLP